MSFINGYAADEDIKIELFLFEPEQISDLVIVPVSFKLYIYLSKLVVVDGDNAFKTTFDYWINYPFAFVLNSGGNFNYDETHPFLFQRFNPYNKPFADEYSIKLFNFFNQFSNFFISDRDVIVLKDYDYDVNPIPFEFERLNLTDNIFRELRVEIPNNNLSLEFSYYYPEIRNSQLKTNSVWEDYYFPRISNECLECPFARYWLLSFNFTNQADEYFIVRKDILIHSLVINFVDKPDLNLYWSDEDKEYVLNQIPDYYLYSNIDSFFSKLTTDLLRQSSVLLNEIEVLKSITSNYDFGYNKNIQTNYINYEYQDYPIDLQPKLLLFANNNNWNNTYSWIDSNNKCIHEDINNLIFLRGASARHYFVDENNEVKSVINLRYSFFLYNDNFNYQDVYKYSPKPSEVYSRDSYYQYLEIKKSYTRVSALSFVPSSLLHSMIFDEIKNLSLLVAEHWEIIFTPTEEATSYHYKYKLSFYNYDYSKKSNNFSLVDTANDAVVELENEPEQKYEGFDSFSTNDNTVFFIVNNELKRVPLQEEQIKIYNNIITGQENCYMASCDLEDIKKDIKEIHRAINAGYYGNKIDGSEEIRLNNLGTKIDMIAKVLGLQFDSELNPMDNVKISLDVESGIDTEIPPGYLYERFGVIQNQFSNEINTGIIYKNISNRLIPNNFDDENYDIKPGIINLCNSIPEYIERFREDLDKAINLQEMGAAYIPNSDGSGKICYFEGIGTLLVEIAWMLSTFSNNINTIEISSLICQAMNYEILKAFGQPITIKNFDVKNNNPNNKDGVSKITFPGIAIDAPSSLTQTMWILQNLQPLIGSISSIITEEELQEKENELNN